MINSRGEKKCLNIGLYTRYSDIFFYAFILNRGRSTKITDIVK